MKTRTPIPGIGLIWLFGCLVCGNALAQASGSAPGRVITNRAAAEPLPAAPAPRAAEQAHGPSARALASSSSTRTVDSVAEDLQRIVVLCATEPDSPAFERAWSAYVQRHTVAAAELEPLIDDILERAAAYRQQQPAGTRSNRALTIASSTRTRMHDTAMAVIRKIG